MKWITGHMKPSVAIVGATGFIGTEVTSRFLNESVYVYLCSQNGGKIQDIRIDSVDITCNQSLIDWLSDKNIDTLIYLSSIIPKSFFNTDLSIFDKNIKMHKSILDAWTKNKFHLIYASTSSVYSRITPIPWSEMTVVMPENYYSISKYVGEMLFYKEYQNNQLPLTILRLNAPYGIENRIKTVINIFIERSLNDEDLVLYGNGYREQDFIYVKDVAQAFWQAYTQQKSGIYNIASGKTITMNELAHLIIELTQSKSKITYSGKEDPQEGKKVSIDVSKSRNELNFSTKYSMRDGLVDCIQEYKNVH
ncbi:MAG: NAD-dependent epimerase/dehydratase family protein [Methanoregula sp.]|nr:NAD-dependent epimerase/dehydratase family protein [Methanoregula sp.]